MTITVPGATPDKAIGVGLASTASADQRKAARAAVMSPTGVTTDAITITADGSKPTITLPVIVTMWG